MDGNVNLENLVYQVDIFLTEGNFNDKIYEVQMVQSQSFTNPL